ncbi:MAG: hypothetical protein R2710_16310 [Acidimicrobiales bacterium]
MNEIDERAVHPDIAADQPAANHRSAEAATGDSEAALDGAAMAMFEARLAAMGRAEKDRISRQNMWLAHHWYDDYAERCVHVGSRWVCRRCASLYPLGILVAIVSAIGLAPWPESIDPWPIWLLSIPATLAYVAEAVGIVRYNPKVQVATTLLAAVAFGRALGYEFVERWSPEFWGPIAVFGGIWFMATMIAVTRRKFE